MSATITNMAARKRAPKKTTSVKVNDIETFETTPDVETARNSGLFRNKRVMIVLGVLILVSLLYYFRSSIVAATVNNKPIFRYQIVKELEKQNGGAVLDDLVTKTLVMQEASKQNITVTQEEIDSEIKTIEENFVGEDQKLEDLLALQGMTREDLADRIEFQILVEKLISDKIEVSDEDVNKYLEANKEAMPEGQSEEELKAGVREQLKQEKLSQEFQAWLAEIRQQANVRYFVQYK